MKILVAGATGSDGVFDIDNMPLTEEPECVINDLNLYSKNSKI